MRKKLLPHLIIIAASLITVFLMTSFANWNFDASQWSYDARGETAFFGVMIAAIGNVIYSVIKY